MIMVLIVLFLGKHLMGVPDVELNRRIIISISHLSALSQMLCVKCRSTRVLSPCTMQPGTQTCTTMST